jgi:hypothetical protein
LAALSCVRRARAERDQQGAILTGDVFLEQIRIFTDEKRRQVAPHYLQPRVNIN